MMATLHRIPHSQPECSLEARVLADRLAACAEEELVSYAEMQRVTGLEVQRKRRDLLQTALRLVLREHQKVFAAVTGQGMKCLGSLGIMAVGEQTRRRTHRLAVRTVQKLSCADPADLDDRTQYRHLAYLSVFGAMAALSHAKAVEKAMHIQGATPKALDPDLYKDLFA
jgi:hypothetical protein